MSCRSSGVPSMDRDLSCPIARGIIWRKGLQEGRPSFLCSDNLMGEDFERSRYTRVLSASLQSKSTHKQDRDVNTSLQARHTWVSAITFLFPSCVSQKSGTKARISAGI